MWPFSRKPKPAPRRPEHRGPQSVDWRVGDIAECVAEDWSPAATAMTKMVPPKIGDRLIVRHVDYGLDITGSYTGSGLYFIGRPEFGYDSSAFRKIVLTDTEADRKVGKKAPRAKEHVHG